MPAYNTVGLCPTCGASILQAITGPGPSEPPRWTCAHKPAPEPAAAPAAPEPELSEEEDLEATDEPEAPARAPRRRKK